MSKISSVWRIHSTDSLRKASIILYLEYKNASKSGNQKVIITYNFIANEMHRILLAEVSLARYDYIASSSYSHNFIFVIKHSRQEHSLSHLPYDVKGGVTQ